MDWEGEAEDPQALGGHGADRAFTLVHAQPNEGIGHKEHGVNRKGAKASKQGGGVLQGSAPPQVAIIDSQPCLALLQESIDVRLSYRLFDKIERRTGQYRVVEFVAFSLHLLGWCPPSSANHAQPPQPHFNRRPSALRTGTSLLSSSSMCKWPMRSRVRF